MNSTTRKLLALAAVLTLLLSVGCNTVRGVGKDVETAGKAIQRTSEKAKD